MSDRKPTRYINATATHRRTERDYMATLLDAVTLDDWQDIIAATVEAAKNGDAQARGFIASYVMGKPEAKAPAAINVMVGQLDVQALVSQATVKTFDKRVLNGLSGPDEVELDATLIGPLVERLGRKFRAVIHRDGLG